jgi:hypothetical protein
VIAKAKDGEGKVPDYQIMSGLFLVTMVTGLLTISYWAGVQEIDELAEEDDFFGDF